MRVLIVLDAFSLGGAEKQAVLFADYLQNQRGCTVEIWAFMPGDGSVKVVCDRYNIKTKVIGYWRGLARYIYPKQIWEYSRLFKTFKPDLLMGYTNQPNLLMGLVWKYTGAKYFIWGQQGIEASGYKFEKKADHMALRDTPCYVSNSVNGAEFLKRELHVPAEKVKVILNGPEKIAPQFTRQQWHEKLGINEKQFKAFMVGHIALRKDHETLIKAWRIVVDKLKPEGIEPIVLLGGILGDNTQHLLNLIMEMGLYPYIKILGNVKDVAGLNGAVDVHILSSNTEGIPNSLLEAMELSLPIIGTNIPGIREAVGEQNYAYLSPPKDHEKLAENILLFARDSALRKKVGEQNRQRILEHFQLDKMCEETWQIITENVK
ncbi:MAG: glycosyltransferase family 4 protein [Chitinophagales bacterium]